jgi:hypothetical protein
MQWYHVIRVHKNEIGRILFLGRMNTERLVAKSPKLFN